MPRPEKVQAVAEIKERLENAQAVFLAEYAGLSVKQQQALRRGLREGGAEFKVVKMTLARRAAAELKLADLDELFLGPTGIAFADGDPVPAAKVLREFAKENETFAIKGGLLGSEFLSPERISALAEIESREVLLANIAGAMQAPMANLAGLLAAMPRNLASAMQQLVDKKAEAGGEEPPAAAADDAAADVTEAKEEAAPEADIEEAPEAEVEAAPEAEEEAAPEAEEEAAPEADIEEAPEAEEEAAPEAEEEAQVKKAADSSDKEPVDEAEAEEEAVPEAEEDTVPEAEEKAQVKKAADSSDKEPVDEAEAGKESNPDGDDAKSVDEDSADEAEEA